MSHKYAQAARYAFQRKRLPPETPIKATPASWPILDEIAAERSRQITMEEWTIEHDDEHADGELALAAACYAMPSKTRIVGLAASAAIWPWSYEWFKRKDRRRDLIRAAALIVAEIERLDRASAAP